MTLRAATLGTVAAGAALAGSLLPVTANAVATAQVTPIVFPCLVPAQATSGHYGLVGNQQNGQTICLVLGERLLVSLSAPAATGLGWQNVVVAPSGILAKAPMPVPVRAGLTGTAYFARHQGIVKLTSQRRVCAPAAGSSSCNAMLAWKVTVVVRAPHKPVPQPEKVAPQPVVHAA